MPRSVLCSKTPRPMPCAPIALGALCAALVLSGCAEDLRSESDIDAANNGGTTSANASTSGSNNAASSDARVVHTDEGGGVTSTRIDATDDDDWVLLDLDSKAGGDDVEGWDVGFRRFKIKSNGGISGPGGVEVAVVNDSFEALAQAPSEGYVFDQSDGDDEDADEDLAFLSPVAWYDYDFTDHTLTPKDVVYVVRTTEDAYFKVQITDYYDAAGTPAFIQLRWAAVAAPERDDPGDPNIPSDAFPIDASNQGWTYWSFTEGAVSVSDPEQDGSWDIAFNRTQIKTNGGTSGGGLSGARVADGAWEAITSAPTVGYLPDAMVPLPGPSGSGEFSGSVDLNAWYDYDPSTHAVTPKDRVYLVRGADGDYAKLQLHAFDDGVYQVRLEPLNPSPVVHSATLDPIDGDWVALSASHGVLAGAAAHEAAPWTVAFQRTQARTYGGTTAADGQAGVVAVSADSLNAVTSAPADGYAADTMVPLPGPPGSGEFSGNAVLGQWYDYDPSTHAVTPKPGVVYVVKTGDGLGFIKLQVTGYDAGAVSLSWAYSGPGRDTF